MVPFGNFGWNFGFGFGWILVAVTFVLMILAIVRLVPLGPVERRSRPRETAFDILKRKYAHGEISKEEYEAKKKDFSNC